MKTANEWYSDGVKALELTRSADHQWELVDGWKDARAAFDECLAVDAKHVDALLLRGFTLGCLGEYDAAYDSYVNAAALRPEDIRALLGAADCLLKLKRFERAVELYERVLSLEPDSAEALVGKAEGLYSIPNDGAAAPALSAALDAVAKTDGRSPIAFKRAQLRLWHATVLARLQRPDALNSFQRLIADEWRNFGGPLSPSSLSDALAHLEVARQALRVFVKSNADHVAALYAAAHMWGTAGYQHRNDELRREALSIWTNLVKLVPNDAQAWCGKADTHRALGEFSQAVTCYDRALALQPDFMAASGGREAVLKHIVATPHDGRP